MSYLSKYVITLVTAIILISAVEIIAPDNSMKKYVKFVLGLILIVVMINPIIYLLTKGEDEIITTIKKYEESFQEDLSSTEDTTVSEESNKAFKENLNKNCNSMLEQEFPEKIFASEVQCTLDYENMTYTIDNIRVGVKDGKVKLVDKIKIKKDDAKEALSAEDEIKDRDEIVKYLTETFKVSEDKIEIYEIEG